MNEFKTMASFSVNDLEAAKIFYSEKLGLGADLHEHHDALLVNTGGDTRFLAYLKEDHKPAEHTVLVYIVTDVEAVVADLKQKGVKIEPVEGTNEVGIAVQGPTKSAWFKDPAGNWFAVFQDS